jgi:hypothetical protein
MRCLGGLEGVAVLRTIQFYDTDVNTQFYGGNNTTLMIILFSGCNQLHFVMRALTMVPLPSPEDMTE